MLFNWTNNTVQLSTNVALALWKLIHQYMNLLKSRSLTKVIRIVQLSFAVENLAINK